MEPERAYRFSGCGGGSALSRPEQCRPGRADLSGDGASGAGETGEAHSARKGGKAGKKLDRGACGAGGTGKGGGTEGPCGQGDLHRKRAENAGLYRGRRGLGKGSEAGDSRKAGGTGGLYA